jgi:proline dehydrogenase
VIRRTLLWLSQQPKAFQFIRSNPLARKFAARFVAGEAVESAIAAAREVNRRGMTASLDVLGEGVSQVSDAAAARDEYLRLLHQIAKTGVRANLSVKLTQMGLDLGDGICLANLTMILAKARESGTFVRIDMESSNYTQRTLDLFAQQVIGAYGSGCGVVIQSCLRRSEQDIDRLIALEARVRLCKGAYLEPPEVAFAEKAEVDRNYLRLMEVLLERGNYPALATHDERIIAYARRFARERGVDPERFEFQMLYGVRRDLQEALRRAGYNVRVYIPFGTQWYPYLMRRLAERPANIAFMVGSIVREAVARE